MMWNARTLRLSPTSQVTGSTPVVVENGMHQPGYPLVHCSERLGCVAEGEDVRAQLGQRQFGHQLDTLPAAPGPGPGRRGGPGENWGPPDVRPRRGKAPAGGRGNWLGAKPDAINRVPSWA